MYIKKKYRREADYTLPKPRPIINYRKINDETVELNGVKFIRQTSLLVLKDPNTEPQVFQMRLTNGKLAYLQIPANITIDDIKIIQHQVEGMLLKIQMDQN